jgi:hypothetical protein
MCSPAIQAGVANREIDGPVLVVSCGNGYNSRIAAENEARKELLLQVLHELRCGN